MGHDFANGAPIFARLKISANAVCSLCPVTAQQGSIVGVGKLSVKIFADEIRRATCNVDVLAHQIAVHTSNEIVRIKVDVFNAGVELSGDVIAHPFCIHA